MHLIAAPAIRVTWSALIGRLSDALRLMFRAADESLRWALLVLAPAGSWGTWHRWMSERIIRADGARATGTVDTDLAVPWPAISVALLRHTPVVVRTC
jgi:hypothetical protein